MRKEGKEAAEEKKSYRKRKRQKQIRTKKEEQE